MNDVYLVIKYIHFKCKSKSQLAINGVTLLVLRKRHGDIFAVSEKERILMQVYS